MSKILKVIESFFTVEEGDTFVLSEDGKTYTCEHNEEFHKAGDSNDINSSFTSTFSISAGYAKQLIEDGYLEEVAPTKSFVNVFDEIDNLIGKYTNDLNNIDAEMANQPQCLKVEKTTVLTNILSVLNHLKTLRK